jgi:Ca-activated chloride channel family protein
MAGPELALQQPLWLLLWPVGPLLWWLLPWRLQWLDAASLFGARASWRHPGVAQLQRETRAPRPRGRLGPWLGWTCLVLALAQPVRLGAPLPPARAPVDLHVLLDTSISMVLRDYRLQDRVVDRLTFAKALLDRFAADYQGERVSLYLLGSPSRRLLAPTNDISLFRQLLARVESVQAGRRAELGDALARLAQDLGERSSDRQALVLLVTDGTQPSGRLTPEAGAERLRRAGVPLYVLAIGAGREPDAASGGLVFGSARPSQLQELARIAGGEGFVANDLTALERAMQAISERHLASPQPTLYRREPLYPWLLLAALLLAALPSWRPGRRSTAS